MVFLKRTPKFAKLILKFEYRLLRPFNIEQMKVLIGSRLIDKKDMQLELDRHAQEVSWSVRRAKLSELWLARGGR
jgi:hypothetical protein